MNPVFVAERRYQNYVIRTNRSSNLSIALALMLLIPALIMSIIAFVAVGILNIDLPPIPILNQIQTPLDSLYTVGAVTLVTMNLAHYLVVALISSGLAIISVQREQRNHTWDLLVLTRMSARQIALGKIRASLWVLRRDLAILTLLRVGFVAFLLDLIRPAYIEALLNAGQMLVVTALVIAWTFLDMVLAVATATASALVPQRRLILLPLTLVARGVTTFGGVIWIGRVIHLLYAEPGSPQYALIGILGLVVFGLLAAGSLKIAEFSAQVAHASPQNISQTISQPTPPAQGHGISNIPSLSQG